MVWYQAHYHHRGMMLLVSFSGEKILRTSGRLHLEYICILFVIAALIFSLSCQQSPSSPCRFFLHSFLCYLALWYFSVPWWQGPLLNYNFWTSSMSYQHLSVVLCVLLESNINFRSLRVPICIPILSLCQVVSGFEQDSSCLVPGWNK